jgi:hypothetical protein
VPAGWSSPRASVCGTGGRWFEPTQKNPLWFQQRTDRPDVFARAKYKRRIQMALRMVALVRAKDGSWFARKGIPEDVRDPYARLFGVRREAHLRLRKETSHHEAKTQCAEWIFETVRVTQMSSRYVRYARNAVGARSRDHRAERSSVLGICFRPFIVRQHAPIVHPLLARPRPTPQPLPRERFRSLALFGLGAIPD